MTNQIEACPDSLVITHSPIDQSRHIILKSLARTEISVCIVPVKRIAKYITITPPKSSTQHNPMKGNILFKMSLGERVILKVLYAPSGSSVATHITEDDALLCFTDLNTKPSIIRISLRPPGVANSSSGRLSARLLSHLDMTYPAELRPNRSIRSPSPMNTSLRVRSPSPSNLSQSMMLSPVSIKNHTALDEVESSEGYSYESSEEEKENLTFLDGTGWVNDYGEVVEAPKNRPPRIPLLPKTPIGSETKKFPATKRQTLSNWEALKNSYN